MNGKFIRNVILKGLGLFLLFNLVWALIQPVHLGGLSLYNSLLRGRERLPYGETPAESYNLSLYDLNAMFASHVISAGSKPADEYRVIIVGDSSTWGTLLRPEETLAGQLNTAGLTRSGKRVRFYNLGYPTLSLTKDLMIIEKAMHYQPDLILWPVTLESFPKNRQLESPFVANNLDQVRSLQQQFTLDLEVPPQKDNGLQQLYAHSIIGQRRALADALRLQLYGVMWSATGIDQVYPEEYPAAATDLEADATFNSWTGPDLNPVDLSYDVLQAGMEAAGEIPVLLINEPMLVSDGANSGIRYNFYYPRWAYDQYRDQLAGLAEENGWAYLDLWDAVPLTEFTNSAIHLSPAGAAMEKELVLQELQDWMP